MAIFGLLPPLLGQNSFPYSLNMTKDLALGGSSFVIFTSSYVIQRSKPVYSAQDFEHLNPASINNFDRKATQYYSTSDDHLRTYMLAATGIGGAISLPFMAYTREASPGGAFNKSNPNKIFLKECLVLGTMYAEGLVFNLGANEWCKKFIDRARPYAYNPDLTYAQKSSQDYLSSFYSNTTALQWYTAGFIAKVVNDWCPHSSLRYYVWGGLGAYSVIQGYLGVRSGQHFPTDVITGAAIGGVTGVLVPALHRRRPTTESSRNKISWTYSPGLGVGGNLQFGAVGRF